MRHEPYQEDDSGQYWDYNFVHKGITFEISVNKKDGHLFVEEDECQRITICLNCGQDLSKSELANGEDTCYPCQKGNNN